MLYYLNGFCSICNVCILFPRMLVWPLLLFCNIRGSNRESIQQYMGAFSYIVSILKTNLPATQTYMEMVLLCFFSMFFQLLGLKKQTRDTVNQRLFFSLLGGGGYRKLHQLLSLMSDPLLSHPRQRMHIHVRHCNRNLKQLQSIALHCLP